MREIGAARGVSRFAMEVGVALLTGGFGLAVCLGARSAGAGWTDFGPDAGYFPFYVGLLILLGSAVNLVNAFRKHRGDGHIFIDAERARFVLSFIAPLIGFAIVSAFLGLYVGSALYVGAAMVVQGKYRWWQGLAAGVCVAVAFYLAFDIAFKVPLLKGPIEALFGIY